MQQSRLEDSCVDSQIVEAFDQQALAHDVGSEVLHRINDTHLVDAPKKTSALRQRQWSRDPMWPTGMETPALGAFTHSHPRRNANAR